MVCITPLLVILCGCSAPNGHYTGPASAAPVTTEAWQHEQKNARALRTPHYILYTTVADEDVLRRLPQVMEGAYAQYQSFAGNLPDAHGQPLRCYVFAQRSEWAAFTQQHTGADAAIYLQITRGGYTIGDWFVSYYVGEDATYSVAAHEGWHQFVARNFKGRLPPFLEEGTACMFESVRLKDDLPRWDLRRNPNRTLSLRNSIENKKLWPLNQLVAMHAGDVVRLPGDRIEAFYSESWAFARFCCEYNGGQYLPAFKKLLSDTATGNPSDQTQSLRKALNLWSPSSVKPMLEHYLGKDLATLETEYQTYIRHLAYQQFNQQWSR